MRVFAVPIMVLIIAMQAPNAGADSPIQANSLDVGVCNNSIDAGGEKGFRLVNEQPVELSCKDSTEFSVGSLPNPLIIAGGLFIMAFVGILLSI